MLGISAWYLLKDRQREFARRSFQTALVTGFFAAALQILLGHYHAVQVTHTQPEKLAAFEGLFQTERGAPLLIFGIPDAEERKVHAAVQVPRLLSFLTSGDFDAEVKGLNDYPREEWPPVGLTFVSFHLMFLMGMYFAGLTALGMFLLWRRKLFGSRWYLTLAMLSLPLSSLTTTRLWLPTRAGSMCW